MSIEKSENRIIIKFDTKTIAKVKQAKQRKHMLKVLSEEIRKEMAAARIFWIEANKNIDVFFCLDSNFIYEITLADAQRLLSGETISIESSYRPDKQATADIIASLDDNDYIKLNIKKESEQISSEKNSKEKESKVLYKHGFRCMSEEESKRSDELDRIYDNPFSQFRIGNSFVVKK